MGFSTLKTTETNSGLALTLEEAKRQLGILQEDDAQDGAIANCIRSAMSYVENCPSTERIVFLKKQFEYIEETNLRRIKIPKAKVSEILSFQIRNSEIEEWQDCEFVSQIGDDLAYATAQLDETITRQIKIVFKAGFDASTSIPEHYKQGLLLILSDFWNLKDDSSEKQLYTIPHSAMRLFKNSYSLTV